jgi:hypothetical protein
VWSSPCDRKFVLSKIWRRTAGLRNGGWGPGAWAAGQGSRGGPGQLRCAEEDCSDMEPTEGRRHYQARWRCAVGRGHASYSKLRCNIFDAQYYLPPLALQAATP